MIRYVQGNLLEAPAEALVNTVNTEGVMGKGIALQFKERFPPTYEAYRAASKRGEVVVGRMFVTRTGELMGPKWIINFPTKKYWRQPSKLEYIIDGAHDLATVIRENGIRSVAVPPLGCGNGGLDWAMVKPVIESALGGLTDVDVMVFEPGEAYQSSAKRSGVNELTPARALIVQAIRRYGVLGFECTNLEAQKLAYFLQRALVALSLPNVLNLRFKAHLYGPYSDGLRHFLNDLDGSYLRCEKRMADAGPMEPIAVDFGRLGQLDQYLAQGEARDFSKAIELVESLTDGFQSPYQMELLSTVDCLQQRARRSLSLDELMEAIAHWPGGEKAAQRKLALFPRTAVEVARQRLEQFRATLQ